MRANLRSKGQMSKVKVTGNENVKIVFRTFLRQSGSIYIKPRPKWSAAHSTHIVEFILQRKMLILR